MSTTNEATNSSRDAAIPTAASPLNLPPLPSARHIRVATVNVLHQAFYAKYCTKTTPVAPLHVRVGMACGFFESLAAPSPYAADVLFLQEWSSDFAPVTEMLEAAGFAVAAPFVRGSSAGVAMAWRTSKLQLVGDVTGSDVLDGRRGCKQAVHAVLQETAPSNPLAASFVATHFLFGKGADDRVGLLARHLGPIFDNATSNVGASGRVVFGGDMNADFARSGLDRFFALPLWAHVSGAAPKTCRADRGNVRFDHLFATPAGVDHAYVGMYPPAAEALLSHVSGEGTFPPEGPSFFSDHAALFADVLLK